MAFLKITARQLEIFVAVARTKSTVAASATLGLSQSAISSAINELERLLGVQLFDRMNRRLILNNAGQEVLTRASDALREMYEIERRFAGSWRAEITLPRLATSTTIGNYILPKLIANFERLPQVSNNILTLANIMISNTADALEAIESGSADVALIEGSCSNSKLVVTHWMHDELYIVAAPHHPLVRQFRDSMVPFAELVQARWLLREHGSGTREALEHALLPHTGQLRESVAFGNTEAIKYAAVEGLGLTCLPFYSVIQLIESGSLVVLSTPLPPLTRNLFIVHLSAKALTEHTLCFIDFCHAFARTIKESARAG